MLLEHVTIRSLINQILEAEQEEKLISLMNQLGQALDDHIRNEERVVFPLIEEVLSEEELQKLAPYLH